MSIGTPNGILDITGATLRVSKMEFRQSTGFDTVLNNVARNTMLLMDETEQTTSNSWALKLPNAWVGEFHGYWASGSSGAPILFNFYNDSTSGTNGYTLSMDDTTISVNYDGGSTLGSATLSSTLNNDTYRKVTIIFERSVLDVSIDGEHVFSFADSQLRDRVYDNNSGYVTFTHSSTDERKLKNLKFTNGGVWTREIDSSNIAYVGGNVGIGSTVPGFKLDVAGGVNANYLIGDGSGISQIQSSNVSDFASNVSRIATLETDLDSNVTRIQTLETDLDSNVSRIATLETDLDSNVTRIQTLETDLDSNVTRIQTLESANMTIDGEKTFSSNLEVGTADLFVDTTTGRVGMGTDSPGKNLHVYGTSYPGVIVGGPNSSIRLITDTVSPYDQVIRGTSNVVIEAPANSKRLFINGTNGKVGIGTNSPSAPLHVQGARSILGNNGGASDIIINDIPQARWKIGTGAYSLNFSKHNSTSDEYSTWSEKVRIDQNGNVGIGTNSPQTYIHLYATNSDPGVTEGDGIGTHNLTEYLRFTSKGDGGDVNSVSVGLKLGGDDNSSVSPHGRLDICANQGAGAGNSWGTIPDKTIATFIGDGNVGIGSSTFVDARSILHLRDSKGIAFMADTTQTDSRNWRIRHDDYGDWGSFQFSVSDNNSTGPDAADEVVMTMTKERNVGIGTVSPRTYLHVHAEGTGRSSDGRSIDTGRIFKVSSNDTNFGSTNANTLVGFNCASGETSSYRFLQCNSDFSSDPTDTSLDAQFILYGNGTGTAEAAWNGGGADYAEMFEWVDGNPENEDRIGLAVKLVGNKIEKASENEETTNIIGVISATAAFMGDHGDLKWKHKYLRDDYGRKLKETYEIYIWNDKKTGEQKSHRVDTPVPDNIKIPEDAAIETITRNIKNPEYDDSIEYTPRSERKEWAAVGLIGKIRIRKGQPTKINWIKMRDISENVEEWFVR